MPAMKIIGGLVLVGVLAAGCGTATSGGTASDPPTAPVAVATHAAVTVDRTAVDTAVKQSLDTAKILTHLNPHSLSDDIAEFREANADLQGALAALTPYPAGVPHGPVLKARTNLAVLHSSLVALIQCFSDGGTCTGAANIASKQSETLGESIGYVAKYGSVPLSTLAAEAEAAK